MFPRNYFAGGFFAPTYFPPSAGESPVPTPRGWIHRHDVDITVDIAADDEAFFLLFD